MGLNLIDFSLLLKFMKIVERDMTENVITVIPQDSDDLYVLYNIITEGDSVSAKSSRRVKSEEGGVNTSNKRVNVFMRVKVEVTEFSGFGDIIRVRGKIAESSDSQITLGSYHSIKIELFKSYKIMKKDEWSKFDLQQLEEAQLGQTTGLLAIIVDDESTLVTQVGNHASRVLLDLEPTIPRKGSDPVQHADAIRQMFKDTADFISEKEKEGLFNQIVLGGPGFTREQFVDFLKINYPHLAKGILSFSTNNSGTGGISELLKYHLPDNFQDAKKASDQEKIVEKVLEELGKDTGFVAYGTNVNKAVEYAAVEELLVLDNKLRQTPELRNQVTSIIDQVKQNRGNVFIISTMQNSSEIIEGLGGIVALLRFPLPK